MSFFSEEANLDRFFNKHRKDKEKIFSEIYSYLCVRKFKNKEDFRQNYIYLLSKEKNKKKILTSGLILEINKQFSNLLLKDEDSSFKIHIEYLKKVKMLDKKTNEFKTK